MVPPHSWPVSAESYRQLSFAAPANEDYHRTVEQQLAMFANVATATASAAVQESSNAAASSAFGKQQNAPMKVGFEKICISSISLSPFVALDLQQLPATNSSKRANLSFMQIEKPFA